MGRPENNPYKQPCQIAPVGLSRKARFASKKRASSTRILVDHGGIYPQATGVCFQSKSLGCSPPKRSENCESYKQGSASGDKTHSPTNRKGNSGGERSHGGHSSPSPFDKGISGEERSPNGHSSPRPFEKGLSGGERSPNGHSSPRPFDKGISGGERSPNGHGSPRPFDNGDSSSPLGSRQQRRRSSWPVIDRSPEERNSAVEDQVIGNEKVKSALETAVPPSLQLQWEAQGVSGKAYQRDGNPSLYRKKKLETRKKLSKHEGIRCAIEKGWWPYLPLRWIILNDTHVLKILPRGAYIRLFEAMYNTLVPTTEGSEAEDAAKWDYSEDAKHLPEALTRVGITREAFSDALFAAVDNWTETVRAKDYIDFVRVLWERVRPDLLFFSASRGAQGRASPDPFEVSGERSSGLRDSKAKTSAAGTGRARTKDHSLTAIGNHGGGIYWPLVEDEVTPPLSPFLAPTPLSPVGLETLRIPGFHHREAIRAPWVSKRDFARDDFSQVAFRGSMDSAEGLEARDKARVMRPGEESKDDCLWDFATRKFPRNARERDAFILYAERCRPDLFGSTDDPVSLPHSGQSFTGGNACPKRYRTDEKNWARSHRRVPTEVLEELLVSWKNEKCYTPAEFGAARLGPLERKHFLAYAIANGWGSRGDGTHSWEVCENILGEWRKGAGRCPEMLVLLDLLEGRLREVAEEALDEAFALTLDLHSIPHPLLREDTPEKATRCLQGKLRALVPPTCQSSSIEAIAGTASRSVTERGEGPITGIHVGKADLNVLEHGGQDNKGVPGPRGLREEGEGREADSLAKHLLQGQRVTGVVHQGQAVFYTCACPTERGTCLEITLQSEGVKHRNSCSIGEASTGGGIAEVPAILSLYATQAHFRPTRLSSYSWISRGKTFHRILLNWKGRQELPVPEKRTNQANSQPEPSGSHPAPIHITIVCPESVPSPDPSAPTDDESGTERAEMTRGASKDVASSAPSRFRVAYTLGVRAIGPPRVVLEGRWNSIPWGDQSCAGKQSIYATFRLPTPLKVTKWGPSLEDVDAYPDGCTQRDIRGDEQTRSLGPRPDVTGEDPENAKRRSSFVDAQFLVTLQVRSSSPRKRVDVYCDTSPRPGPHPSEHTWWMSAGGLAHCPNKEAPPKSSPRSKPVPRPRIQPLRDDTTDNKSLYSSGVVASENSKEDLIIVGEKFSPASPSCIAGTSVTASPRNEMEYGSSTDSAEMEAIICSGTTGRGEQSGDVFTAVEHQDDTRAHPQKDNERQYDSSELSPSPMTPRTTKSDLVSRGDEGWTPLPARPTTGINWSRMTVAMPKDHEGAFHVGVFRGAEGLRNRGGTVDMKAVVWCPTVTVPSRVPLCGHIPRGQRRELLWFIQREAPFVEGRVEVTRAIEDPLVLQQLEFVQNFQRRFGSPGDDYRGQRIPVVESGPECKSIHMRPFVVASKRVSPSQNDYTWRGVNIEGTLEILQRPRDGTNRVFTRYMETFKINPRDPGFGIGRCRLALEAGATDCSFRFLFWNRSPTPQDRTLSWKPVTIISAPMSSSRTLTSRSHHSGRHSDDGGAGWTWSDLSLVTPPMTCRRHSTPMYKDLLVDSRHPGISTEEAYMPATSPRALASETSMVDESIVSGAAAFETFESISNSEPPKPVNDSKDSSHEWEPGHSESDHPASPSLMVKMFKDNGDELRSATAVVNVDDESVSSGRDGKRNDLRSTFLGNRRQLTLATLYLNDPVCGSLMSPERSPARPQMANSSPVDNRRSKTTRGDRIDPALACDKSSWGPVFAAEDCKNISVSLTSRPLISSLQSTASKPRAWRVMAPMRPLLRTPVVVASTTRGAKDPATVVIPPGALPAVENETDACARGAEGVDCSGQAGDYAVSSFAVRPRKDTEIGNRFTSVPSNAQRSRAPSLRKADLPLARSNRGPRQPESFAVPRVPRLRLELLVTPVQEEASLSSCSMSINPPLN